jgi:hypothetical protein
MPVPMPEWPEWKMAGSLYSAMTDRSAQKSKPCNQVAAIQSHTKPATRRTPKPAKRAKADQMRTSQTRCRHAIFVATAIATSLPQAHAADCPLKIATSGKLELVDAKGQKSVIESLDSNYMRRSEDVPNVPGNTKNSIEAYLGFFAETITTTSDRPTVVQYYKLSGDDHARLRTFLPPKPGATLTLDYEIVIANAATGLAPPPAPPMRRWQISYTVKDAEAFKVGDCTYPTLLIEATAANADKSFANELRYRYAPDLRAWLSLQGTFKPTDKPATQLDRTIVSVTALPRD